MNEVCAYVYVDCTYPSQVNLPSDELPVPQVGVCDGICVLISGPGRGHFCANACVQTQTPY